MNATKESLPVRQKAGAELFSLRGTSGVAFQCLALTRKEALCWELLRGKFLPLTWNTSKITCFN